MYHHSQQQGPQPFSNGPRPPHHQQPPNQHQNRPPPDMLSQVMGFQFPRPTQLPDELESALAIRGARDMDHRLIDHMNRPNQHQNQGSGSGVSQHGSYSSNNNPIALTSDNQPGHQQGVDWSGYQPPTKLFASPPPGASHQSQRHQGPQQQPPSSHAGTSIPSWTAPVSGSPLPQAQQPHGGGNGGGVDGQGLYTPESAGSILASFGLSNEDLEVLSHYPDDQLTPDTLPFILRDIQINKSGNQKAVASTSSSLFSCSSHDLPLPPTRSSPMARSRSPEMPSLLTVTQTAGKVIDYGHASRAKDESNTRETFKREHLSSERTVKVYPSSSSSSSAPKADKAERRQVRLEHAESSKHGDRDYRRTSSDHRKSNRSPGREFPPPTKSRNLDRDYRRDGPKPRPPSEARSEASSRRSVSSSSGSKPRSSGSSKKLPTPTMISDFSSASPKVYPHTCSLCHIQCDQEKDWDDHINTVNHTAACRDLRNKFPDWYSNLPSRRGRYGSRAPRDPKDHPLSRSVSPSLSYSPTPSPPRSKHRVGPRPHPHRPHGRPYSPHRPPRHQHYSGGFSQSGVKRPHDDSPTFFNDTSRPPPFFKTGHGFKSRPLQSAKTVKSGTRPGIKTTKTSSATVADTSVRPPPAKKKKRLVTPASQHSSVTDRLVYLTGIPQDASEQEVTNLVGSFGKINNVILMPCSEEENATGQGQKASVCMVKAEDAQALATSTHLSIRDQQITALIAKKPEAGKLPDSNSSKAAPGQDTCAAGEESGAPADRRTSDESLPQKAMLLITGLPESGCSESDVIQLLQPFGTPSDIILATQMGKVLVSVLDTETAQEIVKVHAFKPAKVKDCELKMTHLKPCIALSTPVALYNLLMGSVDPLESHVPVGWSSLLVIRNVPNTPSASSEVQKLVQRFGTVIKTLVLNNMVICEMATAAMALSVYKRFQTFPCIIQNNPLFFSRRPDPKFHTQARAITAHRDSAQDTPRGGRGQEETAREKDSEPPSEVMDKDADVKDEKVKTVGEDEALGENGSKNDELNKEEPANAVSDSVAAPDPEPEADMEADVGETSAAVVETAEEKKAAHDESPAGEETQKCSPDGKEVSQETVMPEFPKVTQEMVNALLVECRTRTASHPNNTTSTNREPAETQPEATEPDKNHTEGEEVKKQERERKESEARKEKEAKERERRAWEKKEKEKDERSRREKREEERREWERRERERRERKRAYGEGLSGVRSSGRWERNKQSSRREEPYKKTEEEEVEFPFDMSDFVTVDEVGDVTDLPCSPSPSVPMETTDVEEEAPTCVQQDAPEDTPEVVATETSAALGKPDEHPSGGLVSSDPAPAASPSHGPTHEAACGPGAPETEAAPTAPLDSSTEVEPPPTCAPAASANSASNSPAAPVETAEAGEEQKEHSAGSHSQAEEEEEEEEVSGKTEEREKMQTEEDKDTGGPAAETGGPAAERGGPAAETGGPAAGTGGPAAETGGPAAERGGPAAETGGPAAGTGGPAAETGGPAAERGGPAAETGGPAAETGGPAAGTGGPAAETGGPAAETGGPAAETGGPAAETGGPAAGTGGPAAERGGPAAGTGGPAAGTGGPAAERGGPAAETGGPAAETGGPAAGTGGPAAETGGPAAERGGPAAGTGGPAAETGGPAAGTGGPAAGTGGPAAGTGGPAAGTGGPAAGTGGPAAGTGGPAAERGGPAAERGGPAAERGGPAAGTGGPAAGTGGPAAGTGGPAAGTGGPAAGTGGPAAERGGPAAERGGPAAERGGPAAETGTHKRPEDHANTEELKKSPDSSLPPYDPRRAVGMEFLVPKTGFFCKLCKRFFSGGKEAEINHCKTLKHYENLQKQLQSNKAEDAPVKPASS